MKTRLVIVGGVAGGATAAARARRIDEEAEITIVERGPYVSYANCGLPYFLSGDIEKRSKLLLQSPEGFMSRYHIKVLVKTEAVEIDRAGKKLRVLGPEGEAWMAYDKLILAQGGNPFIPPVAGSDSPNAFKLWTIPDMDRIHAFIDTEKPSSAVIAGGGFIGLEMAEALKKRGLDTTIVELMPTLMPTMDPEFGKMIARGLEAAGVKVLTGRGVKSVLPRSKEVELSDGSIVPAGLVLFSVGVRPETSLAKKAGLALGESGGLLVDEYLRTQDPDIFAAGDMNEIVHKVSERKVRVPLAGPANRQGRIAASNALGMKMRYSGALGTSVFKFFDLTASSTGLTEAQARAAGFEVGAAVVYKDHHAAYYPGAKALCLKLIYNKGNSRILGAQALGAEGVEKRIDVAAAALQGKFALQDLAELDLAYAPPYSSANDPVNVAAFIGMNDVSGFCPVVTAAGLKAVLKQAGAAANAGGIEHEKQGPPLPLVLDVRNLAEYEKSHLSCAVNIPVDELRERLGEIPKLRDIYLHCRSGYRSYLAARILLGNGFKNVHNITGGYLGILDEGGFETGGS